MSVRERLGLPLARATDPETSHDAARRVVGRESLKVQALAYVRSHPGHCAGEIGDATGLGYQRVWRRLSELKREGLIFEGQAVEWRGRKQATLHAYPEGVRVSEYEVVAEHTCSPREFVEPNAQVVYVAARWVTRRRSVEIGSSYCPFCGHHLSRPTDDHEKAVQQRMLD